MEHRVACKRHFEFIRDAIDIFLEEFDTVIPRCTIDVPVLVIDDESDVGSVDTVGGVIDDAGEVDEDHNPSTINKQIRKLLTLFDQSSYIGYTATPFANVLIHDEGEAGVDQGLRIGKDLFPSNFIISLKSITIY